MKITIESTNEVVRIENSVPPLEARIWKGTTEAGTPVLCIITRVAVPVGHPGMAEFERELREMTPPDPSSVFGTRLVL